MTNAEQLRKYRQEARARGDCTVCRARPAKKGCVTCQDCIDRSKAGKARMRDEFKCETCCRPSTTVRCYDCAKRGKDKQIARLNAAGLCVRSCGRSRKEGRTMCGRCLDDMNKRMKEYRVARLEIGFCGTAGCSSEPAEGRTLCQAHLDDMRLRTRLRRAA